MKSREAASDLTVCETEDHVTLMEFSQASAGQKVGLYTSELQRSLPTQSQPGSRNCCNARMPWWLVSSHWTCQY